MNKTEDRLYKRKDFLSTLMKVEHGKLQNFVEQGLLAGEAEPELLAHFIAWNELNGKVRDSKVAYPVISLRTVTRHDRDLAENAVAHLMQLSPRDLVRAYDFSKEMTSGGRSIKANFRKMFEQGLHQYLAIRENHPKWWDRTVLQHRDSMKRLYRMSHHKPTARAQRVLFENTYPQNSVFWKVAQLKNMTPQDAAGVILNEQIPFQIVTGALPNIKNKDIVLALLEGMTGNQIVTNSKMLENLGVKKDPVLNASYLAALNRAKDDKRLNVLKTQGLVATYSASTVSMEPQQLMRGGPIGEEMQQDLRNLQAQATKKQLGGIEGNWLVLGDCSGSMRDAVELAKKVAALITEQVKGKVWLVFFNEKPIPFEVTGKTFFQIQEMTKRIVADGWTSIGCGLDYITTNGHEVDGIAIVSDGGENQMPYFHQAFQNFSKRFGKEPTSYWLRVGSPGGSLGNNARGNGIQLEEFDMTRGVDYNSLPNLVKTLRTNRYSFVDEIMNTPLLTLSTAFSRKEN